MKKNLMIAAAMAVAGWVQADMVTISGSNIVGFAEVTAPGNANIIVTVPFEACLGNGSAGMLADLVVTNGLTSHASTAESADQLIVLTTNGTDKVYYYYWLKAGDGWTGLKSVLVTNGATVVITPTAAANFPVARGLGFWIKRVASGNSTLYVKGQVSSSKQATEIKTGLNLVGYGAVQSFTLNDSGISWTGAYGGTGNTATSDKIIVVNPDGSMTEYFYFTDPGWGGGYAALNNKWITKSYTLAADTIPAGRGFWFFRRGTGSFTFKPDGE